MSLFFTDELTREFGACAVVEIFKPGAFIKRWLASLPNGAAHFAKKVDYYRPEDMPGNVWPQPHLIATTKLKRFSYQQEYRLGFSTTGALEFEQATQKLVDRKVRPIPSPDEHHKLTLELGDLSRICRLHDLKA